MSRLAYPSFPTDIHRVSDRVVALRELERLRQSTGFPLVLLYEGAAKKPYIIAARILMPRLRNAGIDFEEVEA